MKKILSCILSSVMILSTCGQAFAAKENIQIKNIIYMIPDGGGMEPFYLSDALKTAGGWDRDIYPNSTDTQDGEMYAKKYLVGAITTHSANADVTDSAAAGTALSSGYKTKNGYIGIDPDKNPHANILEAAQYAGKNVGLVSTYEWTNATPASFSAHEKDRSNYTPMSEQIVNQGIDVVLGGGFGAAKWGSINEAKIRGYDIMNTREDLENVKPGDKIWGNLVSGSFPYDIELDADTPNLAEMTRAAVTALNDDNKEGFFLMVEGSKVDGGGHANYAKGMVGEFLAFDEACRVALEFAEGRDDTLVVIVPDHDTGGMNLPEDMTNAVSSLKKGEEPKEITWDTTGHTARHGGMFMYLPEGVEYPEGISGTNIGTHKAYEENVVDNTVIAPYLADIMGVDMDKLTDELFVDVTRMGRYDEKTGMFIFDKYPVSVKSNVSYAFVNEKAVSLDGQVTLYINNSFYVPKLLLDIAEGKVSGESYDLVYPVDSYMDIYMPDSTDITKWNGRIYITNFLPQKEIKGSIRFTAPENFAQLDMIDFGALNGNEQKCIEFECPYIDPEDINFTYEYELVTEDGEVYSFTSDGASLAYAGYANEEVIIDGVLDDSAWKNSITMTCNKASQIVMIEDWKGDRDLSATFSILWDEEYFYMYAVVTDEIFCQEETAENLWKGDSVQFGIFNDTEGLLAKRDAGKVYEEIGIAFIKDEPTAYRFISQTGETKTGLIEKGDGFDMACKKEGDNLTYELKFSWKELVGYDFKPEFGSVLGFSALINDNDGGGRRGWIEYGSGIGMTKNVNEFVSMPMLDFNDMKNREIKIVYKGKVLQSDVAPIIMEDRTLVPVRVIFEALGAEVLWDEDTRSVISAKDDKSVILKIGSPTITVNGEEIKTDVAPLIVNDRTFVPIRAISEAYGCTVEWAEKIRTVKIN